jgi:hypothetical protein
VQSLAYEGDMAADDAAENRSTVTFTRVHSRYLGKAARSSAATLAPGRTPAARRLAALAARVTADLDRLSRSGSDRAEQRRIQLDLADAAKATSRLGKSL